jgi:methylated-DNA-[protein]-cysteine S-methyltransferase
MPHTQKTFSEKVWELTKKIPAGRVATYGDLAKQLGTAGCRAVGNALHRNPYAPVVPCHRVVGSDGSLTGFAGGLDAKRRLLKSEGVSVINERVDLNTYRWRP